MADESAAAIEKVIKKSPVGKWLWTISTLLVAPLLTWMGNEAMNEYRSLSGTIRSMGDRIVVLEGSKTNNEAVWNAIAETNHKITDMRVSHEAGKRHIDWLSSNWLFIQAMKGSGSSEGPKSATTPAPLPAKPPQTTNPPPVPKIDPKDFRFEYEQKFPNTQQQKK
jgi:hypothetical protein